MVVNTLEAIGRNSIVNIDSDNLSSKHLVDNPIITQRSKHIDIKYHFLREFFKTNESKLNYLETQKMQADDLTKPLGKSRFIEFRTI